MVLLARIECRELRRELQGLDRSATVLTTCAVGADDIAFRKKNDNGSPGAVRRMVFAMLALSRVANQVTLTVSSSMDARCSSKVMLSMALGLESMDHIGL